MSKQTRIFPSLELAADASFDADELRDEYNIIVQSRPTGRADHFVYLERPGELDGYPTETAHTILISWSKFKRLYMSPARVTRSSVASLADRLGGLDITEAESDDGVEAKRKGRKRTPTVKKSTPAPAPAPARPRTATARKKTSIKRSPSTGSTKETPRPKLAARKKTTVKGRASSTKSSRDEVKIPTRVPKCIYISGGSDRQSVKDSNGTRLPKGLLKSRLARHGVNLMEYASHATEMVVLPDGVDRPSKSTMDKVRANVPSLQWTEFITQYNIDVYTDV